MVAIKKHSPLSMLVDKQHDVLLIHRMYQHAPLNMLPLTGIRIRYCCAGCGRWNPGIVRKSSDSPNGCCVRCGTRLTDALTHLYTVQFEMAMIEGIIHTAVHCCFFPGFSSVRAWLLAVVIPLYSGCTTGLNPCLLISTHFSLFLCAENHHPCLRSRMCIITLSSGLP